MLLCYMLLNKQDIVIILIIKVPLYKEKYQDFTAGHSSTMPMPMHYSTKSRNL